MSAKLTLSKFELMWLFEGAAGKSHLRWDIYEIFVNKVWPQLNADEREFLYTYIKRDTAWLWENKSLGDETPYQYWLQTLARFNPANQYIVTASQGGKTETKQAYRWNERYYINWQQFFADEYITEVKHCKFKTCTNDLCDIRNECLRYLRHYKDSLTIDNSQWNCDKCNLFIQHDNYGNEQKSNSKR